MEANAISKIKEKTPIQKGLKEKVKAAPKELLRRGLSDGTERLRGQLRDTAQRGQRDSYGGNQIEDAAWRGGRWGERGIKKLLEKKKADRTRRSDRSPSTSPEPPAEPPSWEGPVSPGPTESHVPQGSLEHVQIKTREAAARTDPLEVPRPKTRPQSGTFQRYPDTSDLVTDTTTPLGPPAPKGRSEHVRIKTREALSRADTAETPRSVDGPVEPRSRILRSCPDAPVQRKDAPAPFEALTPKERPKQVLIKTRKTSGEQVSDYSPSDHIPITSEGTTASGPTPAVRRDKPMIKTKGAYIRQEASAVADQPPQTIAQKRELFQREQIRKLAEDHGRGRDPASEVLAVPQASQDGPPVSVQCPSLEKRSVWGKGPSSRPFTRANGSTKDRFVPGGTTAVRAVRPGTAVHPSARSISRTADQPIKTAGYAPKQAVKTAGEVKSAKKVAQTAPQVHRRAVQAVRAVKKPAAATARGAVKAGTAALRAAVRATRELTVALTAGGSVVVAIILLLCLVGLLVASPFGIFFSEGSGSPDAASPSAAIAQINDELDEKLVALQAENGCDSLEVLGGPPSWEDVFAVFAAKTVAVDGLDVAVLNADRIGRLKAVFWDMTKITTSVGTVDHSAEGGAGAWTETVLTVTITPRTPDDMRVFYSFTEEQNDALDKLLRGEYQPMWQDLLYGSSGEIVAVALSQVGNVGGQPYWRWYGFSSHVNWCACFVSWCADQCGYIDAGVVPKFSSCSAGVRWFKARGRWQDGSYEPSPGDLIFFDWNNKGSSGLQDGAPDHVGIVERVEGGVVYTVEGNSSDRCRRRSYNVGHYEIYGYGTLIFN